MSYQKDQVVTFLTKSQNRDGVSQNRDDGSLLTFKLTLIEGILIFLLFFLITLATLFICIDYNNTLVTLLCGIAIGLLVYRIGP